MPEILKKSWFPKASLAVVSAMAMVVSFAPIDWYAFVPLFPFFFLILSDKVTDFKDGFFWGFLNSFVMMVGGFYWVTYVIHTFGYLPWWISVILYLGFCGFGALNLPLFLGAVASIRNRWGIKPSYSWYSIFLPALFVVIEFWVPKLFPWYVGHGFYRVLWINQITEITGTIFLSFLVFSFSGAVLWAFKSKKCLGLLFPTSLVVISVWFSLARIDSFVPGKETLRVGLIQANIGSLEKAEAKRLGVPSLVNHVLDRYDALSNLAMTDARPPQVLIWPETAMPFMVDGLGKRARHLREQVAGWKVPLITGGYTEGSGENGGEYNAAFLIDPNENVAPQIYKKIVLLAFGEYFPGGEMFPFLYKWFPQVSHFIRGETRKPFLLNDGTRLGITICYEAILPEFFRTSMEEGVHIAVNLTNDSWFGPTSEPYQHAALSIMRAIEFRVPMIRVTNTGITFTVDPLGRPSETTKVYEDGMLVQDVHYDKKFPSTFYHRAGEWFSHLCGLVTLGFLFWYRRKKHGALPL